MSVLGEHEEFGASSTLTVLVVVYGMQLLKYEYICVVNIFLVFTMTCRFVSNLPSPEHNFQNTFPVDVTCNFIDPDS